MSLRRHRDRDHRGAIGFSPGLFLFPAGAPSSGFRANHRADFIEGEPRGECIGDTGLRGDGGVERCEFGVDSGKAFFDGQRASPKGYVIIY